MVSNQRHGHGFGNGRRGSIGGRDRHAPEWADGLKQLYDSVIEEDLPDTFKDLLSRLDAIDPGRDPNTAAPSPDGRNAGR